MDNSTLEEAEWRAEFERFGEEQVRSSLHSGLFPEPKQVPCLPQRPRLRPRVRTAPDYSAGTSVWRTSAALNCVTGPAAVPGAPPSTNRTFVGRAVSTLHRPTRRAVIPSPSVTVTIVRWWVMIAVVRRPRRVILRLGGHECAKRDCANAANSQKYSRCSPSYF